MLYRVVIAEDFRMIRETFESAVERAAGYTLVQVLHNGKYCICTKQTAEEHNLKIERIW